MVQWWSNERWDEDSFLLIYIIYIYCIYIDYIDIDIRWHKYIYIFIYIYIYICTYESMGWGGPITEKNLQMHQAGSCATRNHDETMINPYGWWTKSCTTKDDDCPIVYRVLTIPGGAGFCPSTVSCIYHEYMPSSKTTCLVLKGSQKHSTQRLHVKMQEPDIPSWLWCGNRFHLNTQLLEKEMMDIFNSQNWVEHKTLEASSKNYSYINQWTF